MEVSGLHPTRIMSNLPPKNVGRGDRGGIKSSSSSNDHHQQQKIILEKRESDHGWKTSFSGYGKHLQGRTQKQQQRNRHQQSQSINGVQEIVRIPEGQGWRVHVLISFAY
mmetsp:Transcript_29171/g.70329  ORF Transcript_29171/g.70329 Transcript_29171/m.70329 type:complete len:110 (-) Transcript_29171:129-458(-)